MKSRTLAHIGRNSIRQYGFMRTVALARLELDYRRNRAEMR